MLATIVIFTLIPAAISFCAGRLSGRPWASVAIMAALALPLAFLNSPLGPIGPALFVLVLVGLLVGGVSARFLRRFANAG